jgi:hypothetical protein
VSERVLSARELNRAMLARQLLLERSDLTPTAALEQVGGLQTQYAPSGYIGLWSRLRDFRRESLTDALESRAVIQATVMRSTIHMVSAADFPAMACATRPARAEWWLRTIRRQLDGIDMEAAAAATRAILADGPLRATEIEARLAAEGYPRIVWASIGQWVDMVRVPPSGTWHRRKADLYGLAEDWLARPVAVAASRVPAATDGPALAEAESSAVTSTAPETTAVPRRPAAAAAAVPGLASVPGRSSAASVEDGTELLIRRYLGGFGPAPITATANWAGLPAATLRPVMERLDLRRFHDERGEELFDLPDAPLPDAATPAPVRFLPTWDATLLVHARRTQIVPEHLRPLIFNPKTPHSVPTFLVDGVVAGTWRYEAGHVALTPFETLAAATMHELTTEAERLAAFHED